MAVADTSSAPTGNIRSVTSPGITPWASFSQQTREHVPELQWPRSTATYERVLTDAQAWGLYAGTVQPIEGYEWYVDPNGNDDDARVTLLADDLGLPVGEPMEGGVEHTSLPDEFDFHDLLHEALLAPCFGHYYFEWSGEIRDGLWRVTDFASVHPSSIRHIESDRQGRLQYVQQSAGARLFAVNTPILEPPKISQQSLVPFVFWPDATRRWLGRSLLRPLYRNWLCKDVLIRVDVTNHERAGGVPWIETDERYEGTNLEDLQRLASEFKVDEEGGAALPPGALLRLARAGGTDIIGSCNYHDGQMAKVWQTMVRELGQQQSGSGSRAVADVQVDLEAMARRAIAQWAARTLNRWVLARWWLWNTGQRNAPVLRFKGSELETVTAPVETPPAAGDGGGGAVHPPTAAARRGSPRPVGATAAQPDPLSRAGLRATVPARELRRAPTDVEVAAAVDFAAIDVAYEDAADRLEDAFLTTWLPEQLDAIEEAIAYTRQGNVRQRLTALDMARIDVPTSGVDDLEAELVAVAEQGAAEAAGELGVQGLEVEAATDALRAEVVDHARAVAQMIAEGVQVAASRRAVQLVGTGMSPTEVAADVRGYLEDLTHAWERDQLAGAVQQAQNAGRLHMFEAATGGGVLFAAYASELLDSATCDACRAVDGTMFASMAEARRAYPSGGFRDCRGGPRCRGTVIMVLTGETPAL
jgi:hypothetical protein